jgi:TBC1 domain family member 20
MLIVQIVLARKDELLEIPPDEPEMLHSILSKLPKPLDLELLITETITLFDNHPPESLPYRAWCHISSHSVLKTTRNPSDVARQTIQDGETFLNKQDAEMRRTKAIQKVVRGVKRQIWLYRRPAGALGLAVAIGVVAWWMGRSRSVNMRNASAGSLSESIWRIMAFFV